MRFYIIRHGTTGLNKNGDRIRGWADVPLAPEGIEEAKQLGTMLQGVDIQGLLSSDLQRAVHTAMLIGHRAEIPILGQTAAFRPWDLGIYTGQPSKNVWTEMQYYQEHSSEAVPEGESFMGFIHRFFYGLRCTMERYSPWAIGVVTHHRCERLITAWDQSGQPPSYNIELDSLNTYGTPPGSYTVVDIRSDLGWVGDI